MINNFIRVLRNGTLYSDRKTAISNLNTKLSDLQDGEICIASYGASWEAAKTILGVVRFKTVDGVAKRSYTIFDNEANSAEIAAEIAKLDKTVTHTDTNNHVTVKIIEADGLLSSVEVTTADIASAALKRRVAVFFLIFIFQPSLNHFICCPKDNFIFFYINCFPLLKCVKRQFWSTYSCNLFFTCVKTV